MVSDDLSYNEKYSVIPSTIRWSKRAGFAYMIRNVRMFAVLCIIALVSLSCVIFSLDLTNETPVQLLPEVGDDPTETPILQDVKVPDPLEHPQAGDCPDGDATYGLIANHHFWTPTGFGDWVWQAFGHVTVSLNEDGQIMENTAQIIPGSQSREFITEGTHCVFEAPAEVFVKVYGSCVKGVQSLEISEDWQMGT